MDLLKPLIALLAVVNPIGVVPFFLAFTQGLSPGQRLRTLQVSAFSAFCVIATCAAFAASGRIAKVLGRTGINVMTRLMGLILAAMAVELLADGLVKLFPILASPTLR